MFKLGGPIDETLRYMLAHLSIKTTWWPMRPHDDYTFTFQRGHLSIKVTYSILSRGGRYKQVSFNACVIDTKLAHY